ncbi:MAG: TIGR03546 family protein [Gammaproteobacteria bacterium]|nr:TIGR03546 family protein [Gammaproteobacteria bacterium]MDH5800427.1 TIGR03546 family protein [Gammaproteobacteria bacterium]
MLDTIAKLIKVLNAEVSPSQISLGFAAGFIVGLTPLWSLHNLLLLFLVFLFRVNFSAFLLSWAFFSGIAYLADPAMEQLGATLLSSPELKSIWTGMYNQPVWRITHFNNTLTLGSLVCAVVIAVPMVFVSNFLIRNYRQHILGWVAKSKLSQLLKASRLYRTYNAVSGGD